MQMIVVEEKDGKTICKAKTEIPYEIRFMNRELKSVSGAEIVADGKNTLVVVKDPAAEVICEW